jgi:hypothetical protein
MREESSMRPFSGGLGVSPISDIKGLGVSPISNLEMSRPVEPEPDTQLASSGSRSS